MRHVLIFQNFLVLSFVLLPYIIAEERLVDRVYKEVDNKNKTFELIIKSLNRLSNITNILNITPENYSNVNIYESKVKQGEKLKNYVNVMENFFNETTIDMLKSTENKSTKLLEKINILNNKFENSSVLYMVNQTLQNMLNELVYTRDKLEKVFENAFDKNLSNYENSAKAMLFKLDEPFENLLNIMNKITAQSISEINKTFSPQFNDIKNYSYFENQKIQNFSAQIKSFTIDIKEMRKKYKNLKEYLKNLTEKFNQDLKIIDEKYVAAFAENISKTTNNLFYAEENKLDKKQKLKQIEQNIQYAMDQFEQKRVAFFNLASSLDLLNSNEWPSFHQKLIQTSKNNVYTIYLTLEKSLNYEKFFLPYVLPSDNIIYDILNTMEREKSYKASVYLEGPLYRYVVNNNVYVYNGPEIDQINFVSKFDFDIFLPSHVHQFIIHNYSVIIVFVLQNSDLLEKYSRNLQLAAHEISAGEKFFRSVILSDDKDSLYLQQQVASEIAFLKALDDISESSDGQNFLTKDVFMNEQIILKIVKTNTKKLMLRMPLTPFTRSNVLFMKIKYKVHSGKLKLNYPEILLESGFKLLQENYKLGQAVGITSEIVHTSTIFKTNKYVNNHLLLCKIGTKFDDVQAPTRSDVTKNVISISQLVDNIRRTFVAFINNGEYNKNIKGVQIIVHLCEITMDC